MVIDVTASAAPASRASIKPSADAIPMPTKANSPPGPSSRPVSTDVAQDRWNSLASPISSSAFTAISPTTAVSSSPGALSNSRTSIFMPTVKKKIPSSRPLNGSTVASTALRYSVSASNSPATKAPSSIESWASLAMTPAAMTTNSTAAMNSSRDRVEATRRNSGRINSRPNRTITVSAITAWTKARPRLSRTEPPGPAARSEMNIRIGITARSCASSTENAARPTLLVSRSWFDSSSITIAVDDSDRQAPRMSASECLRPA